MCGLRFAHPLTSFVYSTNGTGQVWRDTGVGPAQFGAMAQSLKRTRRRTPVLLSNIGVQYPNEDVRVLDGINLRVDAGEFVCVVGQSGAGKTTLLRVLTGELRPLAGQAEVAGIDLTTVPTRSLPTLRRRIGVTFQDARLLSGKTGEANISYALELTGVPYREAKRKALEMLDVVGCSQLANKVPEHMSGGEQQRVGIARALATDPSVLFADEPTGNLDDVNARSIMAVLSQLANEGMAVLMVTHDLPALEGSGVGRVVAVEQGRIANKWQVEA